MAKNRKSIFKYLRLNSKDRIALPIKVNPFTLEYLEPEERKLLLNYITNLNTENIGLEALNENDQEKFNDLMYKVNLVEAGLV